MKKNNCVITIGWGASFLIEPKQAGALMELLGSAQRVESRWTGEKSVWVEKEDSERLTITQDGHQIVTPEEFEQIKAECEARAEAKKAAANEEV